MPSLIKRPNGVWYGVFSHGGKRVWRSTSTRCEEEARSVFDDLSKEFVSWERLTLGSLQNELAGLVQGVLSPSTIGLYRQAFLSLIRIIGDRKLKAISPYHVEIYKSRRLSEVSPTKINIDLRTLRAAFNRAVQFRMIESNPFSSCKNVPVPEREPRFLSPEEFKSLLRVISDSQMRAIVVLAVCTAMRLGELINLRWNDVDLDRGFIHLKNRDEFVLKGRKQRSVPLNKMGAEVLLSLPRLSTFAFAEADGQKLPWRRVSRKFKAYVRKAGLSEEIHFHTLRHTGASWMVQSNVPISFVKEILGHSNIATTMIYSHSTPAHLRESINTIDRALAG